MAETKAKTKAPPKKKADIYAGATAGDVVIVRLTKGKTAPKPPPGVAVWTLDGDSLKLTPQEMHQRGWVRRKA